MKRILTMFMAIMLTVSISAQEKSLPGFLNKAKSSMDPATIAGLYTYDTDLTIQKMKIRKSDQRYEVAKILASYNSGLTSLKDDNMTLLVGLGTGIKDIIQNKDFKSLWTARSGYKERIENVRKEQAVYHDKLQTELMEVLTRRQKRKWGKYQKVLQAERDLGFDVGDLFSYAGM